MTVFPHPLYRRIVLEPAYADASAYLFAPMLAAHRAHVRMLARQGILSAPCAEAILAAVAQVEAEGMAALAYRPGVEDLFFAVEGRIIALAGAECGGNLQLARSRNDLGAALGRLALREQQTLLLAALTGLRQAVLRQARAHLDTLMAGHTHTQPAQPTTLGHYWLGVASALARDDARLRVAQAVTNCSPLGAAAFTTTGFPIDRDMLARELGFDSLLVNAHDAIGAADHYLQTASSLMILASNLTRVCHDLLILATQEVGGLTVDDSFIQISSIMPQKRNPVVLEHLRARLANVYGGGLTLFAQAHNVPYGDTQDIEDEMLAPLFHLCSVADDCLTLLTAVVDTLVVHRERLAARAADGFTTATELADSLVRDKGLPFRTAHQIVSRVVRRAIADGIQPQAVTASLVEEAARELGIPPLDLDDAWVRQALDPAHFVAIRNIPGGPGPRAASALLDALETELRAQTPNIPTSQNDP